MSDDPIAEPTTEAPTDDGGGPTGEGGGADKKGDAGRVTSDLRDILRNLAQPVIESWDARLRTQVDARVDESVDEKIDAAIQDRLAVLERAVADLDRRVKELRDRHDAQT